MYKINFSEHNKILGEQNHLGVHRPQMPHRGFVPGFVEVWLLCSTVHLTFPVMEKSFQQRRCCYHFNKLEAMNLILKT